MKETKDMTSQSSRRLYEVSGVITRVLHLCREIARELQVNLLGYDYSGYGVSTGQLSVLNVMADIEACYGWLLKQGTKPGSIVAYGQSVSV